jgi:hypothetical protein
MVIALVLLAAVADWVPVRWISGEPQSLELLAETPLNCLVLEEAHWSAELSAAAAERGLVTLGVIRPGSDTAAAVGRALAAKLNGVVLEGDFETEAARSAREAVAKAGGTVIELPPRATVAFREARAITGTSQGVWPGLHAQEDGAVKAAPTGTPWVDTNTGFLRFARAATTATIWIAYEPPKKGIIQPSRYLQAICDAALTGARWIVTLDGDFARRLLARDAAALKTWRQMGAYLRYFEDHREWRQYGPHAGLAVVQDADSGALLAGSILDMVAVKNTPVRPVPRWKLEAESLKGSKMAVSVDRESLTPEQAEVMRGFARAGGTLLSGPPGWRFPAARRDQVTMGKEDVERLDALWKGVNSMVGRSNLGARLFNVSSMLTNLLQGPGGKPVVLHLANFSGYPVENVTVQFPGEYKRAKLLTPEAAARDLELYPTEDGTGVDIPEVPGFATLILD